ncbi:MAG: YihY/virulence factor BrkB family protein [Candidatus Competibacterales bacterium]
MALEQPNTHWGRLHRAVWETPISHYDQRPWARAMVRVTQACYGISMKFIDGQFNHLAASLTYTTLLSLVPMLAVSFSVLKAFGVQNQLEPMLLEVLEPLGPQSADIADQIVGFVNRLQVGVLGAVGLVVLFYTVFALIQKVEQSFNDIWHVGDVRSLGRRFSDYLSAVLIGPVFVFSLVNLAGRLNESLAVGPLGFIAQQLNPWSYYFVVCGVFAFIYGYIPNTTVKLKAAVLGGLFAGVLWYTSGKVFATLVVTSTNLPAIYSGLAAPIFFMIWLYVGWLVILVGGQIAAYFQYPQLLDAQYVNSRVAPHRVREKLALEIMVLAGCSHYYHRPLWTLEALERRHLELPAGLVRDLVWQLVDEELLVETRYGYLPARDIETITLRRVLETLWGTDLHSYHGVAENIIGRLDRAIDEVLGGQTVKDLVLLTRGEAHQGTLAVATQLPQFLRETVEAAKASAR